MDLFSRFLPNREFSEDREKCIAIYFWIQVLIYVQQCTYSLTYVRNIVRRDICLNSDLN